MVDVALRFGAKDEGLNAQFRRVNDQLDGFEKKASGVAGSLGGLFKFAAGIGAVVGLASLAKQGLELADAVTKVAVQTKLTTDEVQRLKFISSQADVEFGNTTNGVLKLQRALGGLEEGSDKSGKALTRLGLNNREFFSQGPAAQFDSVARAIAGLGSQNERVSVSAQLLGKASAELLPVLEAIGSESVRLEAKLASIGGPVGKEAIAIVEGLGDEFEATKTAAVSLTTEIEAIFAPAITAGLKGVQLGIAALRYQITGGNDEVDKLTVRIRELQDFIARPTGYFTHQGYVEALREANRELDSLLRKQEQLLGVGAGGLLNPNVKLTKSPIDQSGELAAIAGLNIAETKEDREARLKVEHENALQRIRQIQTMAGIEVQTAFDKSLQLDKISEDSLKRQLEQQVDHQAKTLQIRTEGQEFLAGVRRVFGLEEIKFETIKDQSILEIAGSMFTQLAAQNSKLAKIQQGIALAQTIWSTASGIMKAFEQLPWPANLAAAAKVALTGAIQIAKIKSTNYSAGSVSGSAPTLAGGGSSLGSARENAPPEISDLADSRGATTVYISGMITQEVIDYMFEGLRDGFTRDLIIIPNNSLQAQQLRAA